MDDGGGDDRSDVQADVSSPRDNGADAAPFSSSDYSSADDDDTSGFIADDDDDNEIPQLVPVLADAAVAEQHAAATTPTMSTVINQQEIRGQTDDDFASCVDASTHCPANTSRQQQGAAAAAAAAATTTTAAARDLCRFDFILFGASGWVGRQALIQLMKSYCSLGSPTGDGRGQCASCKEQCSTSAMKGAPSRTQPEVTFAVAGRDMDALLDAVEDGFDFLGIGPQHVEMIIAEAGNEENLQQMVRRAKILINCVGPYHKYGEQIIRLCIEEGTHYLDLCSESKFIESIENTYGKHAERKGVLIVHSCGFDSIPADVGVAELQKNFHGELLRIEHYVRPIISGEGYGGSLASWESAVDEMSRYTTKEVLHSVLPVEAPYLAPRSTDTDDAKVERCYEKFPHLKRDIGVGWAVPIYLPPRSSIVRSWMHFDDQFRASGDASQELETMGGLMSRPCPVKTYFVFSSIFRAAFAILWTMFLFLFTRMKWTTEWLKAHPKVGGCGMFRDDGPTLKQREKAKFEQVFIGYGWTRDSRRAAVSDRGVNVVPGGPQHKHQSQQFFDGMPNKVEVLRIHGPDPNYVTSAICLTQCAITLLKESDRMSRKAGVLPPGVVFRNTQLINRLRTHSISITMDR